MRSGLIIVRVQCCILDQIDFQHAISITGCSCQLYCHQILWQHLIADCYYHGRHCVRRTRPFYNATFWHFLLLISSTVYFDISYGNKNLTTTLQVCKLGNFPIIARKVNNTRDYAVWSHYREGTMLYFGSNRFSTRYIHHRMFMSIVLSSDIVATSDCRLLLPRTPLRQTNKAIL